MKKFCIISLALVTVLSFAGCKNNDTPENTTVPSTEPQITVAPTDQTQSPIVPLYENMYSVSMPVNTEKYYSEDGTHIFSFSSQEIAPTLQDREVAEKIVLDFTDRIEKARIDSQTILQLAESQYSPGSEFTPLSYQIQYDVTRIDQGVLSLFGYVLQTSNASGANRSLVAANYDIVTGDVLTLGSILYHYDTKDDLVQLVIDQLKSRDDIILFNEYPEAVQARFEQDESFDESFYFSEIGLCFYFAPYEIAPRSSGTVIVEIPYNELTGIIADAYFPAERTYTAGTVQCEAFQELHWEKYELFTEVVAEDATELLLSTDSAVQDIRIYQIVSLNEIADQAQSKNIFAANFLSAENAIILNADFYSADYFLLSYCVNGETKSFRFTVDDAAGSITLTEE